MRSLACAVVLTLAFACTSGRVGQGGDGGDGQSGADATSDGNDRNSDADSGLADGFGGDDGGIIGADVRSWNIVDGSGDCGAEGGLNSEACCNGQFCNGFCLGLADGAVQCSCWGVPDGCPAGQLCCNALHGCTDKLGCGSH